MNERSITTKTVTSTPAGKRMTLAELQEFCEECSRAEIPADTVLQVRTAGFSPVGISRITSGPTG